jgi:glycosyltransferase involved in cell wall biosynthesis
MRIAINALFLVPNRVGGSETYLRGLIRGFDRLATTDQFVLIVGPEAVGTFTGLSERWRVVASPVASAKRAQRILLEQTWLPVVARRLGADVLHSAGYTAPLLPGLPAVVSILDMNYKRHPEDLSVAERLAYAALIPQAARWHDRVITLSEAARADILRWTPAGAGPDKVVVVPGAPREDWPGDPEDDDTRLAAVGVRPPFVLSAAAAYPHKNLERLVSAFPLRGAGAETVQLVLVGLGGRAAPAVQTAIRTRAGVVKRLGWVDDALLAALYRRALALAFPSLYEGFGLPILEAMAFGTPVLTSNYGAMAEVAADAAALVDPRDVEAIREGLTRLASDGAWRAELHERSLKRVRDFSWERTARLTAAIYTDLLSN